jgi:SAM-dependent methyltransferase
MSQRNRRLRIRQLQLSVGVLESAPHALNSPQATRRVDTALFDRQLRETLAGWQRRLSGVVLDVGSGFQPYRDLAQPETRWFGIDLPTTASGRPLASAFGSAEALPVRSGCVDAVLCTQVIEHLPHPWEFFREAARVLRPGGSLLLSAPHAQWLHEEPHDYFRFTRYGLASLASDAGLRIVALEPIGGALALIGFLLGTHIPTFGRTGRHPWIFCRTLMQRLINALFRLLDRAFYAPSDTLGNVLVAELPI